MTKEIINKSELKWTNFIQLIRVDSPYVWILTHGKLARFGHIFERSRKVAYIDVYDNMPKRLQSNLLLLHYGSRGKKDVEKKKR
jgi:hypothetical protein